jgi:hypothetical protein
MKGSLVIIKRTGPDLLGSKWTQRGIVMSMPRHAPSYYSHDFLDGCHRDNGFHEMGELHETADPRLSRYMVKVFWPHSKVTSRHRLADLEFLHMVR